MQLQSVNGGTTTGGGVYEHGASATITATPDSAHLFGGWRDSTLHQTITSNPYTFTVTADRLFVPIFTAMQHLIQVSSTEGGQAWLRLEGDDTPTSSALIDHGSTVTLYAEPTTSSYIFDGWSDGDPLAMRSLTVTSDSSLTALFTPATAIHTPDAISVSVSRHSVTISGADGRSVTLCDLLGRQHAHLQASDRITITVSHPGLYILSIGGAATQKIIIP